MFVFLLISLLPLDDIKESCFERNQNNTSTIASCIYMVLPQATNTQWGYEYMWAAYITHYCCFRNGSTFLVCGSKQKWFKD